MASSEGVRLRPVEESDLSELERLDLDPSLTEPFQWRGFRDWRERRRRWELDGYLGDGDAVFVVAKADGAFAGIVGWRWVDMPGPRGCISIGILLLPQHRGCGIGTIAQRLLVDYLFAYTTANRLEATTQIDNVAEQRALEKAGFRQEGLLRGRGWIDGAWRDGYIYARLRADPSSP